MIEKIRTIKDVRAFAEYLINTEKVSFHPDSDFCDYVNMKTSERTYSDAEADKRNQLMDDCFRVCEKNGADIYEVMGEPLFNAIFQKPL